MSQPPQRPKIYHITHVDNLDSISRSGVLLSDAETIRQNLAHHKVGMSAIKTRRLNELVVSCHPGTKVGEYVPFYFCPRSIMLFLFHRGNHPDLTYTGGQRPLVHLEADVNDVVRWATDNGVRWAFTDRNAGTRYFSSYKNLNRLDRVDWNAVAATDFRDSLIKDGKQAEFLVYESFPWSLVERVGTCDKMIAEQVERALRGANHRPVVSIEREWYY